MLTTEDCRSIYYFEIIRSQQSVIIEPRTWDSGVYLLVGNVFLSGSLARDSSLGTFSTDQLQNVQEDGPLASV